MAPSKSSNRLAALATTTHRPPRSGVSLFGGGSYSAEIPVISLRIIKKSRYLRRAEGLIGRVTKLTDEQCPREKSGLLAVSIVLALGTPNGFGPADLLGEGFADPHECHDYRDDHQECNEYFHVPSIRMRF